MQQAIDQACDQGEGLCPLCHPLTESDTRVMTQLERDAMDRAFWKSVEVIADGIELEEVRRIDDLPATSCDCNLNPCECTNK
jgi:hypothetical protein